MMDRLRDINVLRSACILAALMLMLMLVLFGLLAGCAPTPFVAGREISTPAGCSEARERGHEC